MDDNEIIFELSIHSYIKIYKGVNENGQYIEGDYQIADVFAGNSDMIIAALQIINGTHPRFGREGGYPIKKLYLEGNDRHEFNKWPANAPWPNSIIKMQIESDMLQRIFSFPPNLEELIVSGNQLRIIQNLPNLLEKFKIARCDEQVYFEFPPNLQKFTLDKSDFKHLPPFPLSVSYILISESDVENVSSLVNHAIAKKYECTFEFKRSIETYDKFVSELSKANEEMKAKLIWDILKEAEDNLIVKLMVEREGLVTHLSERHFTNVVVVEEDITKQEESGICIII